MRHPFYFSLIINTDSNRGSNNKTPITNHKHMEHLTTVSSGAYLESRPVAHSPGV